VAAEGFTTVGGVTAEPVETPSLRERRAAMATQPQVRRLRVPTEARPVRRWRRLAWFAAGGILGLMVLGPLLRATLLGRSQPPAVPQLTAAELGPANEEGLARYERVYGELGAAYGALAEVYAKIDGVDAANRQQEALDAADRKLESVLAERAELADLDAAQRKELARRLGEGPGQSIRKLIGELERVSAIPGLGGYSEILFAMRETERELGVELGLASDR
jgi:hypothetical protein